MELLVVHVYFFSHEMTMSSGSSVSVKGAEGLTSFASSVSTTTSSEGITPMVSLLD